MPRRPNSLFCETKREAFEAAIAPSKGGELSGLRVMYNGTWLETLQLARDYSPRAGFGGKGPFLWPATGRNFPPDLVARRQAGEQFDGGSYEHGGVRRPMPIHGFARDLPWEIESTSAGAQGARALLSLADSAHTRRMYPFGFRCTVEYVVEAGDLGLHYLVTADEGNSEPMFFSIGNHITFLAPLVEGSDPGAMVLTSPSTHGDPQDALRDSDRPDTAALLCGRDRSWQLPAPGSDIPCRIPRSGGSLHRVPRSSGAGNPCLPSSQRDSGPSSNPVQCLGRCPQRFLQPRTMGRTAEFPGTAPRTDLPGSG